MGLDKQSHAVDVVSDVLLMGTLREYSGSRCQDQHRRAAVVVRLEHSAALQHTATMFSHSDNRHLDIPERF